MSARTAASFVERRRMIPVSWEQRIDTTESIPEVVEVARQFLAMLDLPEVAILPPSLRPRKLVDESDVSSYAFDLVRYDCREFDPSAELVHRMAAFFSYASIRLSQIVMKTNDDQADAARRSA